MPERSYSICIFSKAMSAHRDGSFLWPFMLVARDLVSLGHRVTVVTTAHPDGRNGVQVEDGADVHYLAGTKPEKTDRSYWQRSAELFDRLNVENGFDVAMGRGTASYGFCKYSRTASGIPLISHEGTYPEWLHAYEIGNPLISSILRRPHALIDTLLHRELSACLERSNLVVCNSPALTRAIREAYWWRDVNSIFIPYGFDTSPYDGEPNSRGLPSQVAGFLSAGTPYLVFVGRVTRRKGGRDLVRILSQVEHAEVRLLIVGNANDTNRRRVEELAGRLGVSSRVFFAGPVRNDLLPVILGSARALLFPSVHPESLPKAVLEAMAARLPILAYDIPAFEGLVEDGRQGYLARAGDTAFLAARIDSLLSDENQRRKIGDSARNHLAEGFSREQTGRMWQAALDSLLVPGQ